VLCLKTGLLAEVKTSVLTYREGQTTLEGLYAFDDAFTGKRPGILVVHDWMGVTDSTRETLEMLARGGYAAFASDIYGQGIRPSNPQEAAAEAGKYKADRALLRKRVNAGLVQLQSAAEVDSTRLAALGFCFGGTTVLELARSGANVQGVVSFHGGLDSPSPEDGKHIKSKVLVLHGADDPFVKPQDIIAFQEELRKAKVDWQMMYFGNAVHSFTQQKAGTDNSKGAAYNEPASRRSWLITKAFFSELFGSH